MVYTVYIRVTSHMAVLLFKKKRQLRWYNVNKLMFSMQYWVLTLYSTMLLEEVDVYAWQKYLKRHCTTIISQCSLFLAYYNLWYTIAVYVQHSSFPPGVFYPQHWVRKHKLLVVKLLSVYHISAVHISIIKHYFSVFSLFNFFCLSDGKNFAKV